MAYRKVTHRPIFTDGLTKQQSDKATLKALLEALQMTASFAKFQERRAKESLAGWHARNRKNGNAVERQLH